jgi:hypothetical protein
MKLFLWGSYADFMEAEFSEDADFTEAEFPGTLTS